MTNNESYTYTVLLAGLPLALNCRFPYAAFEEFQTDAPPCESISVPNDDFSFRSRYRLEPENSPQDAEFARLLAETGNALLKYDRCLLHGTAFLWRGKAWIFTAPSGTGKTTQYLRWKQRYGDELTILNGDKPILEFRQGDSIRVHPSPWKGKENMGRMESAPLGGIICLKQGAENRVRKLAPSEAALPLYSQFLFLPDCADRIDRVCALETWLLRETPLWELTNRGDIASAELMHDTLDHEVES